MKALITIEVKLESNHATSAFIRTFGFLSSVSLFGASLVHLSGFSRMIYSRKSLISSMYAMLVHSP